MEITPNTIVNNLEQFGQACLDLAAKLTDSGRPLNRQEASLVRQAMLSWVEEIMEEIKVSYMVDSPRLYEASERLHEVFKAVEAITR
jgi:hypothetical protein